MQNVVTVDHFALVRVLTARRAQSVLLMLPEGLLQLASFLAEYVSKETGATVAVNADEHWGSCDIPTDQFDGMDVDTVVSFGHTPWSGDAGGRIVFFPLTLTQWPRTEAFQLVLRELLERTFARVSVSWSTEFETYARHVATWLKGHLEVLVHPARGRLAEGQLLGCDYGGLLGFQPAPDAHLIVGDAFHATGSLLYVEEPVFWLNPFTTALEDISPLRRGLRAQRRADLERARVCRRVGILVERRPGQRRWSLALRLRSELQRIGKEVLLVSGSDLSHLKLRRFASQVDIFVSTACPRLESDPEQGIHVISAREAWAVCGGRPLDEAYAIRCQEAPGGAEEDPCA